MRPKPNSEAVLPVLDTLGSHLCTLQNPNIDPIHAFIHKNTIIPCYNHLQIQYEHIAVPFMTDTFTNNQEKLTFICHNLLHQRLRSGYAVPACRYFIKHQKTTKTHADHVNAVAHTRKYHLQILCKNQP